jgi:hypothetical protein
MAGVATAITISKRSHRLIHSVLHERTAI